MEIRKEWLPLLGRYAGDQVSPTLFGESIADATRDELLCIIAFLDAERVRQQKANVRRAEFMELIGLARLP